MAARTRASEKLQNGQTGALTRRMAASFGITISDENAAPAASRQTRGHRKTLSNITNSYTAALAAGAGNVGKAVKSADVQVKAKDKAKDTKPNDAAKKADAVAVPAEPAPAPAQQKPHHSRRSSTALDAAAKALNDAKEAANHAYKAALANFDKAGDADSSASNSNGDAGNVRRTSSNFSDADGLLQKADAILAESQQARSLLRLESIDNAGIVTGADAKKEEEEKPKMLRAPSADLVVADAADEKGAAATQQMVFQHFALSKSPEKVSKKPPRSSEVDHSELEVPQYVDAIYQHLRETESKYRPRKDYMSLQPSLRPHMRAAVVEWLIEVHGKYDLVQETIFLMVNLMDRFLCKLEVSANRLQLLGTTCLLLASKYEDIWPPEVKELVYMSANAFEPKDILAFEPIILSTLGFHLTTVSPLRFAERYMQVAELDKRQWSLTQYLLELSLLDYALILQKPSTIAAACVHLARSILGQHDWSKEMQDESGYSLDQLKPCIDKIHALFAANMPAQTRGDRGSRSSRSAAGGGSTRGGAGEEGKRGSQKDGDKQQQEKQPGYLVTKYSADKYKNVAKIARCLCNACDRPRSPRY